MCDRGETGILEVKCPYSARNVAVADAVETDMQFCMELCIMPHIPEIQQANACDSDQ